MTITMPWKWQQLLTLHHTTSHMELWTTYISIIIERLRQSKYLPRGSSQFPQKLVIGSYSIILKFCTSLSSLPCLLHYRLSQATCCTMQDEEPPHFTFHSILLPSPHSYLSDILLLTPINVLSSMWQTMCHIHTQQVKVKICENFNLFWLYR